MGGQIAGDDPHRPQRLQPAGNTQHFQFGIYIEAVTGFDFDRRDALGKKRIETGQRCAIKTSSETARVSRTEDTMPPPALAISS